MRSSRKGLLGILTLLLLLSIFIFTIAQEVLTEDGLKEILDNKEAVFEDISIQMGLANWNVYTGEGEADQDTPKARFAELFADKTLRSIVQTWHGKREDIVDPTLKRRVDVWHDVLAGARVDMDEDIFKLENQLEAWMALPAGHEDRPSREILDERIIELLRLRNEKARESGYENYAEMVLEITGLGTDWFDEFQGMLDKRTQAPYRRLVDAYRKENEVSELGMEDVRVLIGTYYRDVRSVPVPSDSVETLMIATLEGIGIDYEALPLRIVEKQVPYGGNGLSIRIPDDFRIVLNLNRSLTTWMHEVGHGLEGMMTEVEDPILKGYEWCMGNICNGFMEGTAELMVNFVHHPAWLKKYAALSEEDILAQEATRRKYISAYLRSWLRRFMMEVELYKDLDQDFSILVERLDREYYLVDQSRETKPSISSSIMPVSYPVYLHNYMVGQIFAWQVHETLAETFGDSYPFNPEVGGFLKERIWADGATLPWQEIVKRATGRELDVDGYLTAHGL